MLEDVKKGDIVAQDRS